MKITRNELLWLTIIIILVVSFGATTMYYEGNISQIKIEYTSALAIRDAEIEHLKGPVKFRAWLEGKECRMVRIHPKNQR